MVLYYVWGLNEAEIAYCYKITESRVSQILKGVQERLRKRIEKEEQEKGVSKVEELLQKENGRGPRMECEKIIRMEEEESREMEKDSSRFLKEWFTQEIL